MQHDDFISVDFLSQNHFEIFKYIDDTIMNSIITTFLETFSFIISSFSNATLSVWYAIENLTYHNYHPVVLHLLDILFLFYLT